MGGLRLLLTRTLLVSLADRFSLLLHSTRPELATVSQDACRESPAKIWVLFDRGKRPVRSSLAHTLACIGMFRVVVVSPSIQTLFHRTKEVRFHPYHSII